MKTCAVILDTNGNCVYVAEIRNLNDKQYQELVLEQIKREEEQKSKELELKLALDNVDKSINELAREIRVLKGEE